MLTALQQQEAMPLKLRQRLAERFPTVLSAMREIAESYLLRGKRKPDDSDSGDGRELGFCRSTVLQGASGIYRPGSGARAIGGPPTPSLPPRSPTGCVYEVSSSPWGR
mmetsp:Transcript_20694/g.49299  ORF Transcript_20694/g.49299 Transcript_20694/m.49299 type:complete len:108 (-) Transcript_20694:108-431(-)